MVWARAIENLVYVVFCQHMPDPSGLLGGGGATRIVGPENILSHSPFEGYITATLNLNRLKLLRGLVEDAKSRRKNFDDLLSSKTLWTIGFGEASGENRIILACNKAREQLRKQGFHYGDVHNVLVQFTGSLKIGELQQALNEMTSGLDQTVNIVFDVGPTDFEIGGADGEENFKVVIFADKPTSTSQE